MSLSRYVHTLGRGPSKSRNLTREEAAKAMGLILEGAEPEAVGALLMLMRYRGETAAEIAGFVDAMRARLTGWSTLPTALDWPSYAAGRSRGHPWFLLSALLVARAGYPVLLHGWNSHQNPIADVRGALERLGIKQVRTPSEALAHLEHRGISYVPVEALNPALLRLLKLRDVLGLRSPVNTSLRALNPAAAKASVQGVFHPSYRTLAQDSASLLGQDRLCVIKGGGGEFERNPTKDTVLYRLQSGAMEETVMPATQDQPRRLKVPGVATQDLVRLWRGERDDSFATEIVLGTAVLALETVNPAITRQDAYALVSELWCKRNKRDAA